MGVWMQISDFWKGFIIDGISVSLVIVLFEVIVKLVLHGEVTWK